MIRKHVRSMPAIEWMRPFPFLIVTPKDTDKYGFLWWCVGILSLFVNVCAYSLLIVYLIYSISEL